MWHFLERLYQQLCGPKLSGKPSKITQEDVSVPSYARSFIAGNKLRTCHPSLSATGGVGVDCLRQTLQLPAAFCVWLAPTYHACDPLSIGRSNEDFIRCPLASSRHWNFEEKCHCSGDIAGFQEYNALAG